MDNDAALITTSKFINEIDKWKLALINRYIYKKLKYSTWGSLILKMNVKYLLYNPIDERILQTDIVMRQFRRIHIATCSDKHNCTFCYKYCPYIITGEGSASKSLLSKWLKLIYVERYYLEYCAKYDIYNVKKYYITKTS